MPLAVVVATGELLGVIPQSFGWVPLIIQPLIALHLSGFFAFRGLFTHLRRQAEGRKAEKRLL